MEAAQLHVAILPTPGMGHLIPLIELARQLVLRHHSSVTFIIPTNAGLSIKPQQDLLNALPENINYTFLSPVSLDDLTDETSLETRIVLTLTRSIPALRETLAELTHHESTPNRPSALVVDVFGLPGLQVAKEFGIPFYIFSTVSAMALVSIFQRPHLDKVYTCEYRDLTEPVKLPGCVPVQGRDMPEPFQDKNMLQMSERFNLADGVLVNSYVGLEEGAINAMEEGEWCKPDIYPVGPLVRAGSEKGVVDGSECLRWLDKHPVGSVLFVSFGSGGTLSHEQVSELAFGLEESGQRFIWVAKSPNTKAKNASYFKAETIDDPFGFLPDRFLDRVKGRGLVVSSWAPQVEILSHSSTGGFLTHCGWNSTLESIVNGVPMIAWPLFAEQRMNATMLTDGLRVAFRVKENDNGIVERDEIAKYVRSLIEGEGGEKMREKMRELKALAAKALCQDGSSTRSLSQVAHKWANL